MNPSEILSEDQVRSAVQLAADVAGGVVKLADRLSVPAVELEKWMGGTARPPVQAIVNILKVLSAP